MKKLMLLRHGKSDWAADFGADHDRPLADRGRNDARLAGSFLKGCGKVPQVVLSSTAVRALATAQLALEAGKWSSPLESTRRLYETSPGEVISFLQERNPDADLLMLVGHNPVWENLLSLLISGGRIRMTTASLALVEFPLSRWSRLEPGSGTLRWLVRPNLLRQLG